MPACRFDGCIMEALWKPCGNPGEATSSTCPGMDGRQGKHGKQGKLRQATWKAGRAEREWYGKSTECAHRQLTSSLVPGLSSCQGSEHASGDPRNPEWQCPFWEFGHLGPHVLGLLRLVLGDRQKSLLGAARHRLPGQARGAFLVAYGPCPCPRG